MMDSNFLGEIPCLKVRDPFCVQKFYQVSRRPKIVGRVYQFHLQSLNPKRKICNEEAFSEAIA
jgi:hypothetical protein